MSATQPLIMIQGAQKSELWRRIFAIIEELDFPWYTETDPEASLIFSATEHKPDAIICGWEEDTKMEIHAVKHDDNLYRLPIFVVSESADLDKIAAMINAGVEDCVQAETPDILIKSRLCNALKTKFYYDYMLDTARDTALRDTLTGLWNHRQFHELLHTEMAKQKRSGAPVTVMMLDLDRFKRINDTYGHPVGDQVIIEAASILKTVIRPGDVVARYGGEEFGLVLPDVDREHAFDIAERIRESVLKADVRTSSRRIPISVSIGLAVCPDDCGEASDLVQIADMALLQAKTRGRNRIDSVRTIDFHHEMREDVEFLGVGGNWNAWIPEQAPLVCVKKTKKGSHWEGKLVLPTGKNKYKFMSRFEKNPKTHEDHLWFFDNENPERESDGFGGFNSIVRVPDY